MKFGRACQLQAALALLSMTGVTARAAELKNETLQAFEKYIEQAKARITLEPASANFLWIDSQPENLSRVREGQIVVLPAGRTPLKVPNGLIHDWIGTAFIPHATIDEVFAIVRDYGRYREFYAPLVIDSKPLERSSDAWRFEMLMMNNALFSKSALDGEYSESYSQVGADAWYSLATSTHIRQIDHYGEPDEELLPEGEGSGYIWRLFSISKFVQRDGGVYIELEVIALSRGIPASLHWLIDPMVRRVARGSLLTSLEKTRAAVNSGEARESLAGRAKPAEPPRGFAAAYR